MRRRLVQLVLGCIVLLDGMPVAGSRLPVEQSAPPRPTAPSSGLILGKVVEGTGNVPVADALVTLRGRGTAAPNFSVMTDAEGNFVFLDLPAASYDLRASKDGYSFGTYGQRRFNGPTRMFVLGPDQHADAVRVPLWKSWAISGTVRDDLGEPVVGIAVHAMGPWVRGGRELISNTSTENALTDDRGVYRISGVQPGRIRLVIPPAELTAALTPRGAPAGAGGELGYAPGFRPGEAGGPVAFTIRNGEERSGEDFQLRLTQTHTLKGRLTGADPAHAGGIRVRLVVSDEDATTDQDVDEAETAGDGSFMFGHVAPGTYLLRVVDRSLTTMGAAAAFAAAGGAPSAAVRRMSVGEDAEGSWATVPVTVGDADVPNVSVPLLPSRHISGQLIFNGTAPQPRPDQIEGTMLLVQRPNGRFIVGPAGPQVEADATGHFRTFGLPSGTYFVRPEMAGAPPGWALESITLNGRNVLDAPISVEGGDVDDVQIRLTDKVSELEGSVWTADGVAASDATVVVFPSDPRGWIDFGASPPRLRWVKAGVDGSFRIRGLPPGEYLVTAIDDELDGWQTQSIIARLSRGAMSVTVATGERKTLAIRTVQSVGDSR